MSQTTWNQTLITQQVDGTALANSTTATSLLPAAARYTLPANLLQIGTLLKINAAGRISNIVTTPGTLTVSVRLGSTTVFSSGAFNLNVVAKTDVSWLFEALLVCRSIGGSTSATLWGLGKFTSESIVGSPVNTAGGVGELLLPVTAPGVGTGFDSTAAQTVDLFGAFSVANAGNSVRCDFYELILAN